MFHYYTSLEPYKPLILQIALAFTLSLLLYFFSIPSLFLLGLNTYIHPDDVSPNPNKPQSGGGSKVAIRRASDYNTQGVNGFQSLSSKTTSELKNRKKSAKDKFEFDESKAQIFRLRLGDGQLASRIYFDSYRSNFNCFFVGIPCFCLHEYLNSGDEQGGGGVIKSGSFIPILLLGLGVFRVFISLIRISFDRSATKRSERQLGLIASGFGFFMGIVITLEIYPSVFDFKMNDIDGYGRLFMVFISGCLAGFIYLAAKKFARSFWLGTDQIRCQLPIISCGWFTQCILYGSYLSTAFTALLWISPFSGMLINQNFSDGKRVVHQSNKLFGNVGMSSSDFATFRVVCLAVSGVLQLAAVRPNLQMFLNEAMLCWYQRLHASKIPELEYSRAKVFLHNHYLCSALLQFFAPGVLVLLFLGLSRLNFGSFDMLPEVISNLFPCSAFDKEVALLMGWWVVMCMTVFTSINLALYRRGVLYIS